MHKRVLNLPALLRHTLFFLLGPRQTGKSTLLRASLPDAVFVDFLESETFHELSSHPERLRQRQPDRKSCLIIDEIQLMLDRNPSLRVAMTGSSARKFRRGAANLLGGKGLDGLLEPVPSRFFSRFLDVAGMSSGEQVNCTAVANDGGVPAQRLYQMWENFRGAGRSSVLKSCRQQGKFDSPAQ